MRHHFSESRIHLSGVRSFGQCIRLAKLRKYRDLVTFASARRTQRTRFPCGASELKDGATGFVRLGPQPAAVGIDDRPVDRQAHPHAVRLRGVGVHPR